MTSKKIYKIGLVVLVIINATLIFLLTQRPYRPPRPTSSGQNTIVEKISNKLELSKDQMARYQSMAKQHGEQMRILQGDHSRLMKDYIETLDIHSTASVEQIRSEILKIESAKLQYTYEHFEELKSILNEQQKSRFGLIIKDITIILIGEEKRFPRPPRD